MSESVVFNFDEFNSYYPELNATLAKAKWSFSMASLILSNTPCSIVECAEKRKQLLYLLAAHVLYLQNRGGGAVGSISNAHEGSVSVGYASLGQLGQNYFGQSQYGLLFWQLVKKYMSGFYVPEEC